MSKSKKPASSRTLDNLNPLLSAIVDAVVRHTSMDQIAVESLRLALASVG